MHKIFEARIQFGAILTALGYHVASIVSVDETRGSGTNLHGRFARNGHGCERLRIQVHEHQPFAMIGRRQDGPRPLPQRVTNEPLMLNVDITEIAAGAPDIEHAARVLCGPNGSLSEIPREPQLLEPGCSAFPPAPSGEIMQMHTRAQHGDLSISFECPTIVLAISIHEGFVASYKRDRWLQLYELRGGGGPLSVTVHMRRASATERQTMAPQTEGVVNPHATPMADNVLELYWREPCSAGCS